MKVLVDTNILISAFLFPGSLPARCLEIVGNCHKTVLCSYIIDETREVIGRKWPDQLSCLDSFFLRFPFELAPMPEGQPPKMADPADSPILHAAMAANVDIIVSGDKHFLALNLKRPKTISPRQFLDCFSSWQPD